MAIKVTIGQVCDGTISKNTCHEEYYLCGKFHAFMIKVNNLANFWGYAAILELDFSSQSITLKPASISLRNSLAALVRYSQAHICDQSLQNQTPPVDSYTIVLLVLTLSTTQTTQGWF